jgi:hypothetical protein
MAFMWRAFPGENLDAALNDPRMAESFKRAASCPKASAEQLRTTPPSGNSTKI